MRKKSSYDVVLDLTFGDSGKGRVVDWLSKIRLYPIVIRFNGGHQAGHHVMSGGRSHVFSNFGSGTLQEVPTFWSEYCTVDPVGLMREYSVLRNDRIRPEIFISSHSPITTPLDKEYNHWTENINNHGSVGVGFGSTIKREEEHFRFKFLDIFYDDIFKYKIEMVKKYYESWSFDIDWNEFIKACRFIRKISDIHLHMDDSIPEGYDSHIFESAQGLLLDQDYGFFPHVTRSNTGIKNIPLVPAINPTIWLVTRAYQTRHGNGPMTNEINLNNKHIKENEYEENKMHSWQGNFRTSVLDLSLLEYSLYIHKLTEFKDLRLVITCVDNMEKYCLTYRGVSYAFNDLRKFVVMISDTLRIPKVYISDSPHSEDEIKKL